MSAAITPLLWCLFGMGGTIALAIIADSAIKGFTAYGRITRELGE